MVKSALSIFIAAESERSAKEANRDEGREVSLIVINLLSSLLLPSLPHPALFPSFGFPKLKKEKEKKTERVP